MSTKSFILLCISTILIVIIATYLSLLVYYKFKYKVAINGSNIALFKDNKKIYEEKHLNGISSYEVEDLGTKIIASPQVSRQTLFDDVNSRVNFYVYFPNFIPDGFEIKKEISIGPSKENTVIVTYSISAIGDTSLGTGAVWILQENINGKMPEYFTNKWSPFLSREGVIKKDATINGVPAMVAQEINDSQTFTTLIFEKDMTGIVFLHSRLEPEILIKIAESMR